MAWASFSVSMACRAFRDFTMVNSFGCPWAGVCLLGLGIQRLLLKQKGAPRRSSVVSAMRLTTSSLDRKSTRLNSSHLVISYAVFCLKKKTAEHHHARPDRRVAPRRRPWLRLDLCVGPLLCGRRVGGRRVLRSGGGPRRTCLRDLNGH